MSIPSITVVIPSLNEEKTIRSTLDSIISQTHLPAEIIVADGGSTDGTLSCIESYRDCGVPINVVSNVKRLPGAGRNAGTRAAKGEFIAYIDSANIADVHWLEYLLEPFLADPTIDVVYGRWMPLPGNTFEKCVVAVCFAEWKSYFYPQSYDLVEDTKKHGTPYSGSSLLVRKSAFEAVGGFPEWLRTAEDKLFGKQLVEAGCKVVFSPKPFVYHHPRKSLKQVFKQYFLYERGNSLSGQTNAGFYHVAAKYITALLLLILSSFYPLLLLVIFTGFVVYTHRRGYAYFKKFYSSAEFDVSVLLQLPFVLLMRDMGVICGHISGRIGRRFEALYN